jgi:hypothetical protein
MGVDIVIGEDLYLERGTAVGGAFPSFSYYDE